MANAVHKDRRQTRFFLEATDCHSTFLHSPRGAVRASGHSVSAYRNSDDILQIALMMTRIMTLVTLTVLLPFLVLWSPSWAQKSKGKGRIQNWDGS